MLLHVYLFVQHCLNFLSAVCFDSIYGLPRLFFEFLIICLFFRLRSDKCSTNYVVRFIFEKWATDGFAHWWRNMREFHLWNDNWVWHIWHSFFKNEITCQFVWNALSLTILANLSFMRPNNRNVTCSQYQNCIKNIWYLIFNRNSYSFVFSYFIRCH